jgi:hypothetical protein
MYMTDPDGELSPWSAKTGVIEKGPISKDLSGCIVLNDILLLLLLSES